MTGSVRKKESGGDGPGDALPGSPAVRVPARWPEGAFFHAGDPCQRGRKRDNKSLFIKNFFVV